MSKRLITQYILIALFSIHRAMGQSYFDAAANGTLTVEPSSSYEFLVSGLTWDQAYYSDDELNGNAGAIFSDTDVRDAFIEPTIAVTGEGTIDLVLIAYRFNEENYCEAGDTNTECDYTRGPVVVYATSIAYDAAGSPSSSQLYDINFTDYQESSVTADSRQMNRVFYTRPTDITNTSSQSNLATTIPTTFNSYELRPLNASHQNEFSDDEAALEDELGDSATERTRFINNADQSPDVTSGVGGTPAPAPGNAPGCCSIVISNGLITNTATVVVGGGLLGSLVVAVYDYEDDECTNYSWDWLGRLLNSKGCDDDDGDGGGGGDGGEGDGPPPPAVSLLEPGDQDDLFLYIKVSNESTSNMTLSSIQIPGIQSASQERNITFLPELKN
ncbi:MAG: hypothetical protein AAF731_07135 [Bacteroidota bacterium]